jgi:peroxiredoxin
MDRMTDDPTQLPSNLPVPVDDGAADHLAGALVPAISFPATDGTTVRLDRAPDGYERLVVYIYPMTGLPGVDNPDGWEDIPGARGCTPESCGFRDHAAELAAVGAAVLGLSTQTTAYQREVADRLRLPFPLVSDAGLELTEALRLPSFEAVVRPEHDGGGRKRLLRRLTFLVRGDTVEKAFYPIYPPDRHAGEVLDWIRSAKKP